MSAQTAVRRSSFDFQLSRIELQILRTQSPFDVLLNPCPSVKSVSFPTHFTESTSSHATPVSIRMRLAVAISSSQRSFR